MRALLEHGFLADSILYHKRGALFYPIFKVRKTGSVEDLNQARPMLLSRQPGTQMKRNRVLSVDDTFLVHSGEHLDQIANLRDPPTGHFVLAHDLV